MNMFDSAEAYFAALAILSSIICLIYTSIQTNKLNKQNMEQNDRINSINLVSNFYLQIYIEFLITKIPEAREELDFRDKKLVNFTSLVDVLGRMLRNSLYFKYTKPEFYNSLETKIHDIENYIAEFANNEKSANERAEALTKIGEMISDIYNEINTSFLSVQ